MNIFYAFNEAYAVLAGISIYSLLVNNLDVDDIIIHVVDSGISEKNKKRIESIVKKYHRKVMFYNMPDFNAVFGGDIDAKRWNINVYSKLFARSILPQNVKKIISIDCDTVILKSLKELWEINLDGYIVAGVQEAFSTKYRANLNKRKNDYYFNSGVLVFNLEEIERSCMENSFKQYMKKYGSAIAYLDQDVVNAVPEQDKMLLLDLKYNVKSSDVCCSYKEMMKARKVTNYYSESEFEDAVNDPNIIHFTTFFMNDLRPWYEGSKHPKLNVFLEYKELSPWKNEPLWEDQRKGKTKIKGKIIMLLPRFLQCEISSILHGTLIPHKNKINMNKNIKH